MGSRQINTVLDVAANSFFAVGRPVVSNIRLVFVCFVLLRSWLSE